MKIQRKPTTTDGRRSFYSGNPSSKLNFKLIDPIENFILRANYEDFFNIGLMRMSHEGVYQCDDLQRLSCKLLCSVEFLSIKA